MADFLSLVAASGIMQGYLAHALQITAHCTIVAEGCEWRQ